MHGEDFHRVAAVCRTEPPIVGLPVQRDVRPGRRLRRHEDVGALPGCEYDLRELGGCFDQTAVAADAHERVAVELEIKEARLARVHEAPPLPKAGASHEAG